MLTTQMVLCDVTVIPKTYNIVVSFATLIIMPRQGRDIAIAIPDGRVYQTGQKSGKKSKEQIAKISVSLL